MKTRTIRQSIVSSFILCSISTNAAAPGIKDAGSAEPVDLKMRNSHAKELLGTNYKKSAARLHERNRDLSNAIVRKVARSLGAKNRREAKPLARAILKESRRRGFDPVFVMAVIQTESSWNPTARGPIGEIGLMQLRPETAAWIAKKYQVEYKGPQSLQDPVTNVRLGIAYMSDLRRQLGPNAFGYVSAYNMGARNVRRLMAQNIKPQQYRNRVIANYETMYKRLDRPGVATAGL